MDKLSFMTSIKDHVTATRTVLYDRGNLGENDPGSADSKNFLCISLPVVMVDYSVGTLSYLAGI
jgi:hypothetical protein